MVRQFVDGLSGTEKSAITTGVMTITDNRTETLLHAEKAQSLFDTVAKNARVVGMKINPEKPSYFAHQLPSTMMSDLM